MARIRTIKPEFWQDEKVGRLSMSARLLFIGMWNFADDTGVVRGHPVFLRSQIFPYDDIAKADIEKWIDELVTQKMISVFTANEEGFYQIVNFLKHQVINRPSKNKNPQPEHENNNDSLSNHGALSECSGMEREEEREKEKEKEKEKSVSSAPPSGDAKPTIFDIPIPVLKIPIIPGKNDVKEKNIEFPILQSQIDDWQESYPAVDVLQTLREIRQWNIANPTRRKTKSGILNHVVKWLQKEQNNGGIHKGGAARKWANTQVGQTKTYANNASAIGQAVLEIKQENSHGRTL